ncbi:copper resistance system multicopper oxidase [Granulibacter bethesdensis]|uniref:copper resistance system multicopper oxidase n=1 Tax=Granulibacter bethesdensis TaxID=364410 RepID=UPI0003F20E0E|nr:copper resistance system multicopper oxidase [Granulibacter bethesdensis]AHJ65500.1 Multicopper oxidase PcoA [Granulibacter bethesdensis CGDNIH4]
MRNTESSGLIRPDRRRVLRACGAALLTAAAGGCAAPAPAPEATAEGMPELRGSRFALNVARYSVRRGGRHTSATLVNASLPGPVLRMREGDEVAIAVTNTLDEPTSIHWHGLRVPASMDGVPGLSFGGIPAGETFTYRFPLKQSGTYWYHGHSGFQEATGLYGALIIAPHDAVPDYDRDYVVMLNDWSDLAPETIVSTLKFQSDAYNFRQRTLGTFIADARQKGLHQAVSDRLAWGKMRMGPTDISDVSGNAYAYLLNGRAVDDHWHGLFRPGERVRLRFINAASMTNFDIRIPGLVMTVVEADGNAVRPVMVDEFRIGVAETYDVLIQPGNAAYTIFAQSQDRTGYARGTLAPHPDMDGLVPPMDPRPLRTMKDMGMGDMDMNHMDMGDMGAGMEHHGMAAHDAENPGTDGMAPPPPEAVSSPAPSAPAHHHAPSMEGMEGMEDMDGMDMPDMPMHHMPMHHGGSAHDGTMHGDHAAPVNAPRKTSPSLPAPSTQTGLHPVPVTVYRTPQVGELGVGSLAPMPVSRLHEAGSGLDDNGRRVLRYTDLRAARPALPGREPDREILLHLTGNMERYIWGFNGQKFSHAPSIRLRLGERVRFILINDTMMEHPIHLHGLWSELENGTGADRPFKHTILVKPGERLTTCVDADTPGLWAFHCHLLYHMELGMFRTVVVS